jgi:hypothetical protein
VRRALEYEDHERARDDHLKLMPWGRVFIKFWKLQCHSRDRPHTNDFEPFQHDTTALADSNCKALALELKIEENKGGTAELQLRYGREQFLYALHPVVFGHSLSAFGNGAIQIRALCRPPVKFEKLGLMCQRHLRCREEGDI